MIYMLLKFMVNLCDNFFFSKQYQIIRNFYAAVKV